MSASHDARHSNDGLPVSDSAGATRSLHDSDTGSGHLEVRCPNCRAPMDVAVDTRLTDLTCESCGSHFSLVDQSQATRMAPPLSQMGRFELIERLGIGGFGSVWKARDKELDRTVAIKIPRQGGMTGEEQEKFFREARAAAQLRHPSIVSVHEVGRDGDSVYIVSDFVRGVTLGDWLTGQRLTSREAAELCAKVADALDHAHEKGVVHRDLKPANIMMDYDGQPHLMDFGLARRDTGELTVTMDGQILGTPAYMSPEQAQGEGHTADRRSDVYSLGVILFQLLTGELPFRGNARMLMVQVINDEPPSPRKLNANVSKDLETITLKCLEKDAGRRYQTAADLAAELKRYLSGEPILARPLGRIQRGWRWARRNRRVAALTASVAALLVAIAALSTAGFVVAKRQQLAAQEAASREANLRTLAEQNFKLAEEAVDGYLTQVSEDERLKQAGFSKLRGQLLETAIPFFERFAKQKPGDAQHEMKRAAACSRLALIYSDMGREKDSIRANEQAVSILTELVSRYPAVPEYRYQLAESHNGLAWNLSLLGQDAEGETQYSAAIAIFSKLVEDVPNEPKYRQGLANTKNGFGFWLGSAGNDAAAKEQFRASVSILQGLAGEIPNLPDYKHILATSLSYLGEVVTPQQPSTAKKHFVKAVAIERKLVADFPKTPAYSEKLSEALAQLAPVLSALGDDEGARRCHQEAIEIQKRVASEFPDVLGHHMHLASWYIRYGDFMLSEGDQAGALKQYEQGLSVAERMFAEFPDIPRGWLDWMAITHERVARRLSDEDKPAAAREHMQKAVAIRTKLVAAIPDDAAFRTASATQLNELAWTLATSPIDEIRDGKRAVELATRACELSEYKKPNMVDTLAAAYAEIGDFDSAVKWSKKSLEILGKDGDPDLRKSFSLALANYKANKPTRQDPTTESNQGAGNEKSEATESVNSNPSDADTSTDEVGGQK